MNPNHDPSTKIEKEIDAAWKILRETQPPAAMASRIHRSLETAAATAEQSRRGWTFWVPATCAAIAVVLLAGFLPAHFTREKQIPTVSTAKIVAADSVSTKLASSQPELSPERSHERKVSLTEIHRRREHSHYRHAFNPLSYPLTQQEKLLLQFAQNAKPEDLQALNPEYQAKVEAQQEAEFAAYLKSGRSSNRQRAADTNQSIQE